MIQITETLFISENELHFDFVRSSGPGGQNVNKVATAVQLRFDVQRSPSLPEDIRSRLISLAGSKLTGTGEIVIIARRHRTQHQNRMEALDRLIRLIRSAAKEQKRRKKTSVPYGERQRRLNQKHHRSQLKRNRRYKPDSDD